MSGNYPDGTNQASFDRYTEERERNDTDPTPKEQHSTEWLSEVLKKPLLEITEKSDGLTNELELLAQQVGRTCEEMDRLRELQKQLAAALRICLLDYCPECSAGRQGVEENHRPHCSMFKLLEKAEGRKLQLNLDPEVED